MVPTWRRRWRTGAVAAVAVTVLGCAATPTDPIGLSLTQAPPTVQAAYNEDHPGTVIRSVTRDTRGGQHYYTVRYQDADAAKHEVVYNGAGDQIDGH